MNMDHLKDCQSTTGLAVELLQLVGLDNRAILPTCRVLREILGITFVKALEIVGEVHQAQLNMQKYSHRLDDYIPYIVNLIESVTINNPLSETL